RARAGSVNRGPGRRVGGGVKSARCSLLDGDVFFFQAEDGIRDWSVTGVQTCALPICLRRRRTGPGHPIGWCWARRRATRRSCRRSEERRVGKEGRSRGGPEE